MTKQMNPKLTNHLIDGLDFESSKNEFICKQEKTLTPNVASEYPPKLQFFLIGKFFNSDYESAQKKKSN